MKKAKLDMRKKNVTELITLARHIVTLMTGNPNFTTPNPPLADITAKALALETAYEDSLGGSHMKKNEMHLLTTELKHMLSFLASYVNNIAQGDSNKILSSGMELSKDSEPVGLLPAPANLRLENGTNTGMVLARWNNVDNAKSYEVEFYQSVNTPPQQEGGQQGEGIFMGVNLDLIEWEQAGIVTSSKFMIKGLTPGNRILVRVVAVNAEGQGSWSDPATMIIP